ncbi:PF01594 domain protein [Leptospira inadai serovar Lyme str. 10]|uniref:PF01594 domain protein n=2 Tax=Leptospira inadai serovar Lyme TaxID=293084 RepID=V6HEL1_9LEPT|nr:AI-2E family transporter [Leptospira inadai]EQA38537.1 PF01594 domain protein [Leptospira inadai serovar Lyme str. 10]PNV74263.1 AI-2E family transporter [Leptospira inadai serovar Lyme]
MSESRPLSTYVIRIIFFLLVGAAITFFILGLKLLIIPIALSLILFYIFNGSINYFESLGVPRILSVAGLMILVCIPIYWIATEVASPIVSTLEPIMKNWRQDMEDAKFKYLVVGFKIQFNDFPAGWEETIRPEELVQKVADIIQGEFAALVSIIPTLIGYLVITPLFAFLFLLNGNGVYKNIVSLVPNRYFEMTIMIAANINEQITNYLRSLVIQSAIITVVAMIGFSVIGLRYFYIFALFVGIANSIPYLGPIIGAVPPLFMTLTQGSTIFYAKGITEGMGMYELMGAILIVIVIAQAVDNFFVQPVIISDAVSLHPIVVVGAVTVGGTLLGIAGMLVAVPLAAILKVTIATLYRSMKDHNLL